MFGSFGQSQPSASFSFGTSSATAPPFGASSAPASSSGFSFSSTPAFGASSTPSFGASSTPAFGAPSSGGFSFGGSSAPAFGAPASSTPAFGFGASTPAFGATSSTPAFGSTFGSNPSATGQSTPQPSVFGGLGQLSAPQGQQQQQQLHVPFTKSSTFDSLPQAVQAQLQQVQEQIIKYEADRLKVQQLSHLQEAPAQQQGLDAAIAAVRGELKELLGMIRSQEEGLQDFKEKSQQLLKATDVLVRTYVRNKEWRESMMRGEQVNLQKYLTLPVLLPGPYLEEAVQGMADTVAEYSRVLDEVEQVLASSSLQDPSQVDWRTVLPTIVSNMHDYFISVAAKLDKAHNEVDRLKPIYLARLREQGIYADPFERSRRQEQLMLQQQHQQQRSAVAGGHQQHTAVLPAGLSSGTTLPALPAPAAGGHFGTSAPVIPAPQPTPALGAGSFGSPFPANNAFGMSPFGGNQNSGLSRSASKPKSKKR